MEGGLINMDVYTILQMYKKKRVSWGGEIFLNFDDSIDFVSKCQKNNIPINRIEIVQVTDSKTISSLEKIIDYDDQYDVYSSAVKFLNANMDKTWNYASFVN
jgi:hypothetical protein